MEVSDFEIIRECLNGDQDSFALLVTRYKKLVYSVVLHYIKDRDEAEDMSQEVFLKIYKALGSYNPEYKFSTWSVKIATNLCLDYVRKKRINSVPIEEIEAVSREEDTPEKAYIESERKHEIYSAINALPEKYRTPVILYHEKGASYKEIADKLNEPMSIVKNRLYRARLILRESLFGPAIRIS